MARLAIAPIVEGHGEEKCVPDLLRRIGQLYLPDHQVFCLKPQANPKSGLLNGDLLRPAVIQAANKLHQSRVSWDQGVILILIDADTNDPRQVEEMERGLLERAESIKTRSKYNSQFKYMCTAIVWEYETWFVAAAGSLTNYLKLKRDETPPLDPEKDGLRKRWVEERFRSAKYRETIDQLEMTRAMDLNLCFQRSPSFRRLCEGLQRRVR